jgi:hypothetical protein
MGERWCTVTVMEESGRRHSLDILAGSTFDAAHIFVTHAKADPRNGIPRPTMDTVLEVAVGGNVHRVAGKDLQWWILKEREERKGPPGILFSRCPTLDDFLRRFSRRYDEAQRSTASVMPTACKNSCHVILVSFPGVPSAGRSRTAALAPQVLLGLAYA